MSAASFFNGVFPSNNSVSSDGSYLPVPVYMVDDKNDYLIRAYTKCPQYVAGLGTWYKSDDFSSKEASTEAFRLRMKALVPSLDCNLTAWWNV
eukprot:gene20516-27307_t